MTPWRLPSDESNAALGSELVNQAEQIAKQRQAQRNNEFNRIGEGAGVRATESNKIFLSCQD